MNVTIGPAEIEAAKYWLTMGAPNTYGNHDFEPNPASYVDDPVTWIDGADYTKEEFKRLGKGQAAVEKLRRVVQAITGGDDDLLERLITEIE